MSVPKWFLGVLSFAAAALGALVGVVGASYSAGERLGEMATEVRHLADGVGAIRTHESRLGVAETRLNYCCPVSAPRATSECTDCTAVPILSQGGTVPIGPHKPDRAGSIPASATSSLAGGLL